jgi:hypothetical protein
MKLLPLLIALALTGCDVKQITARNAWDTAPLDYVCTEVEMIRVEREAKWCRENTSYLGTYCYGAAMMRTCAVKRGEPKP